MRIIFVLILGIFLGFLGVIGYQKFTSSKFIEQSVSDNEMTDATPRCQKNYKYFENAYFSICILEDLDLTSDKDSLDTDNNMKNFVLFENSKEFMSIDSSFLGGWGGSPCQVFSDIVVSGFSAKRYLFYIEKPEGGCSGKINGVITVIYPNPTGRPYMLNYSTKGSGDAFVDSSKFIYMEQSLIIKKL